MSIQVRQLDNHDEEAEREAVALCKQGRSFRDERVRQQADYNQTIFDQLFSE